MIEPAERTHRKIQTLIVVPWDKEPGGVVSVAENLAKYLAAQGHGVFFLHPGKAVLLKRRTTNSGFPGVELRLSFPFAMPRRYVSAIAFPLLFPIVLVQLIWFLRRHRIQIVNVHFPNDRFFYFAICRHLLSIRLVTSVHGSDVFAVGRPKAKYSGAFRFLIHSSDLIVVPSDSYRKKLLEVFPDIYHKTIFIHNGIDPAEFSPPGITRKDRKSRYILCIASLSESKGIDVLLRASKPLLTSDDCLSLALVGDGPLRAALEATVLSLGIYRQVRFYGSKGRAEIIKLLHGCEVLVLPSRAESFGLVLIEALACKKPVVATAVGGIPEIIEHQKSGILVEPDNAGALTEGLYIVLTDSELRRSLAENGYTRVMQRFCIRHSGAAYETAFASLLDLQRA